MKGNTIESVQMKAFLKVCRIWDSGQALSRIDHEVPRRLVCLRLQRNDGSDTALFCSI